MTPVRRFLLGFMCFVLALAFLPVAPTVHASSQGAAADFQDDDLIIDWDGDGTSMAEIEVSEVVRSTAGSTMLALHASPAQAQGPAIIEFPICTHGAPQQRPAISGDIVVWMDSRNDNHDIYGFDLSTGTEFPISINPADQYYPAISGDIVVWFDSNRDIYAYDLSTGTELPICTDPAEQVFPDVSEDVVVWQDYRKNNWDIFGYDLSTHTEFPICTNPRSQSSPSISGDVVVWSEYDSYGDWNIYGYDLSTHTQLAICTNPASQSAPAIFGDIVVWSDGRNGNHDIYGFDLSTGTEFPISINPADQYMPEISGGIVVWYDDRGYHDIYGYDLSTHTEFPIRTGIWGLHPVPDISGDVVVWGDFRNRNLDIYGARLGLAQLKVCIDPGHGGTQPGAVGWDGDAYPNEKDFTLDIALRLRDLLESEGIEVVMTREEDVDVDLQTRCDIANNNSCDIFVSIHCNSAVPIVDGTETYIYDYLGEYFPADKDKGYGTSEILNGNTQSEEQSRRDRSYELAFWAQRTLTDTIHTDDRGVKSDTVSYPGRIYVLRATKMPAALIEVAFISNPTEFGLLSDPSFRQEAAQGIANGIHDYFFKRGLTMHLCSPADMIVTDPDGLTISKLVNEIPGATYTETDIDGDGDIDDQVRIPDRKIGDYIITVIPEPDALPTDTYTLEVSIFGTPIILAEDVEISDIPTQRYILRSTETRIEQIVPATIDFDPDVLYLGSKGKWVTAYVELPEGWDVEDIDLSTVLLNEAVPAITDPQYLFVTDPNTYVTDYDEDGILERLFKFDRSQVQQILDVGEEVEITITGEVGEVVFEGSDNIRVIGE